MYLQSVRCPDGARTFNFVTSGLIMQPNLVNGWREVLAAILDGFDAEFNVSPEWLISTFDTNRRLKLDYLYREVNSGCPVRGAGGHAAAATQER